MSDPMPEKVKEWFDQSYSQVLALKSGEYLNAPQHVIEWLEADYQARKAIDEACRGDA